MNDNLNKHIEKDHLELKYICDICDNMVERKKFLTTHKMIVHE